MSSTASATTTSAAAAVKPAPASSSSSSDAKSTPTATPVPHQVPELKSKDAKLQANEQWKAIAPKYAAFVAADSAVEGVRKALEEKKHKVTVVDSPAAALAAITTDSALPKGASVAFGGSITLDQIGLIDYVKTRTDLKNYRAEALALMAKGDFPGSMGARFEGTQKADLFFTSVAAVTESGELINADASGTRTAPMLSGAKHVVVVVSANKIVKDVAAGLKRLEEYVVPLEGAHIRAAYGMPDTALLNITITRGSFVPARFHVVIIKGHALGY